MIDSYSDVWEACVYFRYNITANRVNVVSGEEIHACLESGLVQKLFA